MDEQVYHLVLCANIDGINQPYPNSSAALPHV